MPSTWRTIWACWFLNGMAWLSRYVFTISRMFICYFADAAVAFASHCNDAYGLGVGGRIYCEIAFGAAGWRRFAAWAQRTQYISTHSALQRLAAARRRRYFAGRSSAARSGKRQNGASIRSLAAPAASAAGRRFPANASAPNSRWRTSRRLKPGRAYIGVGGKRCFNKTSSAGRLVYFALAPAHSCQRLTLRRADCAAGWRGASGISTKCVYRRRC